MLALLMAAALAAPDVYFISVDTLRADHLGCYGYQQDTSPNIDGLAGRSMVFDNCLSEVPLTAPSFGSMLTSRVPRDTGVVRNGIAMPKDVPTVAERFKEAGYQTFCIQSNWTLKADLAHLNRGFDTYDDDFHKKRWGVIKPERYADEVTQHAVKRIKARDPKRPLFCWIHYSDPHAPYRFHRHFAPSGKVRTADTPRDKAIAKYDSEIAYTDHHLGDLLKAIPKGAYIVFVADHGESLYEHGYVGHGRHIYQPGIHIPLIIHGPGIAPGRSSLPVCGLDVGATLLGLAGLAPAPGMQGLDVINGTVPPDRVRVFETYGGAVPKVPVLDEFMADRPPMSQGVMDDGWKLILTGDKAELYRLQDDPGELNDLAGTDADRVQAMKKRIQAWDETHQPGKSEDSPLSKEDIKALESLGYVQ